MKELDANPAAEETVFIYKIKNGQALNVEYVMNLLFNGNTTGRTGTRTSTGGGQPPHLRDPGVLLPLRRSGDTAGSGAAQLPHLHLFQSAGSVAIARPAGRHLGTRVWQPETER